MNKNKLFNTSIVFFIIMFLSIINLKALKISDLPDVFKPNRIMVFKNKIYLTEETTIKIFNSTDGKFEKKFGMKGEGPGEFKFPPILFGYKNSLIANTSGKIVFFSLEGDFKKEIKVQGHNNRYIPLADNFVGRKNSAINKGAKFSQDIGILDKNLKIIKDLYKAPMPGMMFISEGQKKKPEYKIIKDNINYNVMDKKVFISDTKKGFYFKVFDKNGKLINEIKKNYKKELINENYKKRQMIKLKSQPFYKMLKNNFRFVFPEYFPAFKSFILANNRIFVQTYKEKDNRSEFIVLDTKGNELKRYYLPVIDLDNDLYSVNNNKFLYLIENEDIEKWELHSIDL